jgi:hypothetical protein
MPQRDWNRYARDIEASYWDRDIPAWVDGAPSMTHRREKAMLYHLTKDFPGEINRIIDAGSFSGASTLAFAKGLKDSGRPTRNNMIVSYDLFETDRLSSNIFSQFGKDVPVGSSFLPVFFDVIKGHEDLVSVVKGSILDFDWLGGPIDILFLDVLKSQELNDHCSLSFFPELIEGKSLILHQDYIHDPLPWIPLTMAALGDHFEMLGWCKNTVAFRCIKAMSRETVASKLAWLRSLSLEQKDRLYDSVLAAFPDGTPRINMSLSRIWMMFYHGDTERARREVARFPITETWVQTKIDRLSAALARS